MKRVLLPQPPNADDQLYASNPLAFNRAMSQWARITKGILEDASRDNDGAIGQQFQVGVFTTNTTITGTATLTDVANFVASLVTALTDKGLLSPTVSRSNG